jgi:hypothetical protein
VNLPECVSKTQRLRILNGWEFEASWENVYQELLERFGIAENGDTSVLAKNVQSEIAKLRYYGIMEFFLTLSGRLQSDLFCLPRRTAKRLLDPPFPRFIVVWRDPGESATSGGFWVATGELCCKPKE